MTPYTISICITSYNRVFELERALKSIDFYDGIEVIISEDCSPRREDIRKMVEGLAVSFPAPINLHLNEKNLGYDNNLGMLKSLATGEYVLYMSDDDVLVPGALEKLANYLKASNVSCGFTPFLVDGKLYRKYDGGFKIAAGPEDKYKHIYDAILFSGLVFKTELVKDISAERFLNYNYFQVYLLLTTLYNYGGEYIDIPLVDCISDGENAFGNVESSDGDEAMKDRKSIFATLALHKGLVKSIKEYDIENNTNALDLYAKQYSKTLFSFLCEAQKENRLKEYYDGLQDLGMKLGKEPTIYYYLIKIFGVKNAEKIMQLPRNIYRKRRMIRK